MLVVGEMLPDYCKCSQFLGASYLDYILSRVAQNIFPQVDKFLPSFTVLKNLLGISENKLSPTESKVTSSFRYIEEMFQIV